MELKTVKEEKDMVRIELIGESHTFANLLREELYVDEKVKGAAYLIEHPIVSNPQIMVRVEKGSPNTALKDAAKRIEKKAKEFTDKLKKAL